MTTELVPVEEMPNEWGTAQWVTEECSAIIRIREDANEETLVHELLHLVLDGHKRYRRYSEMSERAINRIAAALVYNEITTKA
jgi:Zn-dependent peptidase ImmA (M78 family)